MPKEINIGDKFGDLTVVKQAEDYVYPSNGNHIKRWICKCKIGHTITAFQHNLLNGHTSRCTICGNGKLIDLTGYRFGKLVVIQRGPDYVYNGGSEPRWFCRCDCDSHRSVRKMILVRGSDLRSGSISSCGCYRKTFVKQSNEDRKIAKLNYMVGLVPCNIQLQPNSVPGVTFLTNAELAEYRKSHPAG